MFLFIDLSFFIDHLSLALMVQATSSSGDYCTCQQYICYFFHAIIYFDGVVDDKGNATDVEGDDNLDNAPT